MPAAKFDIRIEQGADFKLQCTIKDDADAPLDLTAWNFTGALKEFSDGPVVASFGVTKADQVANTGQVTFALSSLVTADIPAGRSSPDNPRPQKRYVYDVYAVKPDASTDRLFEGVALVVGGVAS